MPQCCPRQCWIALILLVARALLLLFALLILAGCSVAELEQMATDGEEFSASPTISQQVVVDASVGQGSKPGLLSLESVILGGQQDISGIGGTFRRLAVGAVEEVVLRRPVDIGGVDNILYIVDADRKLVFQYDLISGLFRPTVIELATHVVGDPGSIYVAKDHSFYIVDSLGKQVLHFSEDGSLLGKFQDLANLSRPMDVTVDELTGNVFVADGSFGHVVVFNSFGKAIRAVGRRGSGPGRFLAITAMAAGADGLYIFDRLGLPVQVFSWDGSYRYSFAEDEVSYPLAAAVDRAQRVYISEQSDNSLRVYQEGRLLTIFGGSGAAPGRFRSATGLWVHDNRLYVADSLNRRVQVLRINPSAVLPVGAP